MEVERGEGTGGGGRAANMLRLIEKATNSTDRDLDPCLLKAIKTTARSSSDEVRVAVHVLMDKMKKEHSQVRYLALLVTDELFMRSKLFRILLVVNLEQFLTLSVGFRRNMPLPPPAAIASLLRSKSIELLEKWNTTFGIHYRQLRLGFDYLKNTLGFQFPNRLENEARLQQERREREMRSKEIIHNKFKNLEENYSLITSEIHLTLDQLGECLDIVQVEEDEFNQNSLIADDEFGTTEFKCPALRQIRLDSLKEGAKIQENSDNKAIFDALRELYKVLVSKHLKSVQECISILVRVELQDNRFRDSALKEFIDIRNLIRSTKARCEESGCVHDANAQDEEDIWEEGKIEIQEPKVSTAPNRSDDQSKEGKMEVRELKVSCAPNRSNGKSVDTIATNKNKGKAPCEEDISSNGNQSEPTSLRSKLLAEAPVMVWGSSFDNWGSNRDALANQRGLELESHWGRVDHDAVIPASKIAELNVHVAPYEEPAADIQPCLAPLKKGGLCQRRDLKVCPFHGPIVPHDADGVSIEQKTTRKGETAEVAPKQVPAPSEAERIPDSNGELAKKLAKQAIKNVRKREDEVRALKRAKVAKVRQHNEAVLQEAAVAYSSHSGRFSDDITMSHQGKSESELKKPTLASMLQKKVTTKDRLAQKLLSARATDATIRQLTQAEEAAYKEAYPNQW